MALTKAQRARLEKLATYLEGLPEDYEHFGMWSYFTGADSNRVREYALHNGGVGACGAVACAVGHGPAAGVLVPSEFVDESNYYEPVDWNEYAGLFVGDYDTPEYDWCFEGNWRDVDNHHWGAAARIRYLLDAGEPPPAMVEARETAFIWRPSSDLPAIYAPYRIDAKVPA